ARGTRAGTGSRAGHPRRADGGRRHVRPAVHAAGTRLPAGPGHGSGDAMTGIVVSVATTLAGAAALVAWLRRRFVVIDVDGRSMQPTLHEGDRVLVRRRPLQHIRTGDIVIVQNPGRRNLAEQDWVIKRAVAVPG